MRDDFLLITSHELRTPLTVLDKGTGTEEEKVDI
jgi:signal transduction histidine kinase